VLGRPQRVPGTTERRLDAEDLLARTQGTDLQPRDGQQLADHPAQPICLLGDRLEVDARRDVDPLALLQLGRQGADAGERRLQVVGDAPQEVGLHRGHAVELISLGAQTPIQERMLDRGGRVLAEQAEETKFRGSRYGAALPRGHQDGAQFVARGHVGGDERTPGPNCVPRPARMTLWLLHRGRPPVDLGDGLRAVRRTLRPCSQRSRSISRTFLMDSRSVAIRPPLLRRLVAETPAQCHLFSAAGIAACSRCSDPSVHDADLGVHDAPI